MNHERLADAGAAGSILAAVASFAAQTMPIVQWLAGVVAIAAGVAAAYYHIKKAAQK